MKIIDFIVATIFLISVGYFVYAAGYNNGKLIQEPVSECVEFSDYKSSYKLHKDSMYRTERIEDSLGVTYFIYIWYKDNFTVIEYQDTLIDGEFTFAKHWHDSFIANFEEELK